MTDELTNGHNLQSSVKSFYQGKEVRVWCSHEDCYVMAKGEYGARDRAVELSEDYDCPMDPSKCVLCGNKIAKERDICKRCRLQPGYRVYDLDENGDNRNFDRNT